MSAQELARANAVGVQRQRPAALCGGWVFIENAARQEAELRDLRASETLAIPDGFPFRKVPGLSNEMIERLHAAQPGTLAAAGRVPGITPAALAALLVHTRRAQAPA